MLKKCLFMTTIFVLAMSEAYGSWDCWARRGNQYDESLTKRTRTENETHLTVKGVGTAGQVATLLEQRPKLESLDLGECNWLTDADAEKIAPFINSELKELNLGGYACRAYVGDPHTKMASALTNKGLAIFVQSCKALVSLDIWLCLRVDDAGASIIAKHCPALTYLKSGNTAITGEGYIKIFEACKNLEKVDLMYACNNGFYGFKISCGITDDGLFALAANCKQLTALNLMGCTAVSDEGIARIFKGCPNLAVLVLAGCGKGVTNGILDLVRSKEAPNLAVLNVNGCAGIGASTKDYYHLQVFKQDHPHIRF